jgi:peptide/nickel transport system ATP-binding protein
VVPQASMSALNPVMRVGAQFGDVLAAHRRDMSKADRRRRAAELMDMVGVSAARLDAYPHQLSGGQRQRVTIALALALEPQLVVLDEPTTALDVVTQRGLLENLTELQRQLGFAMLFITHDLSLLIEVADEVAIMYAGRVVEYAPARTLLTGARHPYTQGLLRSFPPLHGPARRMSGIGGAPPDLRHVPAGCPFHPRCDQAMDRCRVERPPMLPCPGVNQAAACWLVEGQP